MKIRVSILIICLLLLFNPITYAVKVVFKATPMSTNLIEGPYAVFVYYKIYDDDTDMSNIEGFIDMPLLKKNDIKNIFVKKSDKLIIGQKVIQMTYSGQYIGQQKNTIDISRLNNGIYIIKLIANNTILTNKFVKQ